MNKTQTVKELISQFDIELDLTSEVLNLKIEGDFDSYTIIQRVLCIKRVFHSEIFKTKTMDGVNYG